MQNYDRFFSPGGLIDDFYGHFQSLLKLPKGPRLSVIISVSPHVYSDTLEGLFFGFGYATAQDRLFPDGDVSAHLLG